MDQSYMKENKILPLILTMSLPMILGMLVNSLYNIVDSYFVAKISEEAMTAISLVYPIQLVVTAVTVGLGIGVNAIASYFLGAEEEDKADTTVALGLFLSVIQGIILTVGCIIVLKPFVSLFTSNQTIMDNAIQYGIVAFLFTIPNSIQIAYEKIFQAEGKMTVSMIAMMAGCIANIILDPMMIFGYGFSAMGIQGAALATGLGQVVSLVVYLFCFYVKGSRFHVHFNKNIFNANILKRVYVIAFPSMINLSLGSIMITLLNGILAQFSDLHVLVLGIYYKLQTFIYLTVNGLVQGIRPLISYNYGASENNRVKEIYKTSLTIAIIIMTLGTIISWLFSSQLISLFTSNLETINIGITALRIISCGFIISSVSVIVCGTEEALGNGNASLFISLLRFIIILVPVAFILAKVIGSNGVWLAFPIAETTTTIISYFLIKNTFKKTLTN